MKIPGRLGCFFPLLFLVQSISAQQGAWCGSDRKLREQISTDAASTAKWEQLTQQWRHASPSGSRATNETIYIPVVFHIIYDNDAIGAGENISDAQCISAIDALNRMYNGNDPDITGVPAVFAGLAANCNIHFCLAAFDESNQPTPGIIRHAYPLVSTWDSENDIDNTLKPATQWDPNTYLNIWSVRMGGQLITDGILAYSSFPGFGQANHDGVVARYTNIGTTSNVPSSFRKGKTLVHEVGHWLGLMHTWGFDAGCGDFGDFIDDTPDQADANFLCPTFPHISCNNGPDGDMYQNYMDYANEGCQALFTIDQAARMQSTLNGTRASVKNAATSCFLNLDAAVVKLVLPVDTVCSLTFKPVVTVKNAGVTPITSGKFYFQIDGGSVQIVNWNGMLASQEQVNVTLPVQTVADGSHTFDISFGNVNGQASDGFSGNDNLNSSFFAIDFGNGITTALTEDFELAFPPSNWANLNPNNDLVTWTWNTTYGGFGLSYGSAYINNLAYTSNPNGKKDAFITESYDLNSIAYPELRFDVAYARNSALRSDSLNVYCSFDCGSNWQKIWSASGTELATAPDQTTLFVPDPAEWKRVAIPLTAISAQNKVSFKFENVADWGNAMYIDNINVANYTLLKVIAVVMRFW
jgi:hypothetical protein